MKKLFWNLVVILNFYLILYFWFTNSNYLLTSNHFSNVLIALGRLTGLLGAFLILIQLFLISRFSSIEKEYGFDKLANFHKNIGLFLSVFLISHPILLTLGYAVSKKITFLNQFLNFENKWEGIFSATIAIIIIIFTGLISIKKIREKIPYEVWYFAHLPLYIAVVFAFGHQIKTGDMSSGGALFYWYIFNIVIFGLLIIYRFIKPLFLFNKHSFTVENIVRENENVYSVYLTGRNMNQYKFRSGQYATLIFLQKDMWFHHPFSFSNPYNSKNLRFTIKTSGNFTSKVKNIKIGTKVWIDGPLGTFTLNKSVNNKYVFIAGGIGITPILSIIKSIKEKSSAVLLYSNKTDQDINFQKEISDTGIFTHYFNTGKDNNRINIQKIIQICPDFKKRDFYLCGPEKMTLDLVNNLKESGVTDEQIHFEKFNY